MGEWTMAVGGWMIVCLAGLDRWGGGGVGGVYLDEGLGLVEEVAAVTGHRGGDRDTGELAHSGACLGGVGGWVGGWVGELGRRGGMWSWRRRWGYRGAGPQWRLLGGVGGWVDE